MKVNLNLRYDLLHFIFKYVYFIIKLGNYVIVFVYVYHLCKQSGFDYYVVTETTAVRLGAKIGFCFQSIKLIYRPFHKTLPRSRAVINQISVRFYETNCIITTHDYLNRFGEYTKANNRYYPGIIYSLDNLSFDGQLS